LASHNLNESHNCNWAYLVDGHLKFPQQFEPQAHRLQNLICFFLELHFLHMIILNYYGNYIKDGRYCYSTQNKVQTK